MSLISIFGRKTSFLNCEILNGKTDRHSHILFGVDDGVATLEESLKVLEIEEKAGFTDVWCTPHIMEDLPNLTKDLKKRFAELQQAYKGNLRLHLAAEFMLDSLFEERLQAGDLLTMEDNTVLVETSTWNPPPGLHDTLRSLQVAGYRPLLAHPERYRYLDNAGYETLIKLGVHFQLNLASLVGYYGDTAKKKAHWLLEKGCYTEVGTDCHRFTSLCEQLQRETLSKETLKYLK